MKSNSVNRIYCLSVTVAILVLLFSSFARAADIKLPIISGKKTLATVNDEPITLDQYEKQFVAIHEDAMDERHIRKMDPAQILERMIKVRLITQEAERMGMDELEEVRKALEGYEQGTLRSLLFGNQLRNVRKADPKEIKKIYTELAKEVEIASIRFDKEDEAKSVRSAIDNGVDFAAMATKAIDEGKAIGFEKGSYIRVADLSPEIARIITGMKSGEHSQVLKIANRFAILKVGETRIPRDAAKQKEAEEQALRRKRSAALKKYVQSLEKKYVKYDKAIIKELDFEAAVPGFNALLQDDRPVARIKGEDPVTVKEWAEALNKIFFHGIDQAIKQKSINKKKNQTLEQLLEKRVVLKEARRLKYGKSEKFKELVREHREELLFGVFVQKVVEPHSKSNEEELRAYLREHISEYTVPEKIRFDILIFTNKDHAQDAIGKLRGGADFQWMRANAPGQASHSVAKEIMDLGGMMLVKSKLPGGLEQTLAGVREGDLRLHDADDGLTYVVSVQEVIPPKPEEYESVKETLAQKMFNEKRKKALEEWADKLREVSTVKIYANGEQLRRILDTKAW